MLPLCAATRKQQLADENRFPAKKRKAPPERRSLSVKPCGKRLQAAVARTCNHFVLMLFYPSAYFFMN